MLRKSIYTIWVQDSNSEDATLLSEPTFKSKREAFECAKRLAKRPMYCGCKILVRKIYFTKEGCSEDCVQWEFDCVE